MTPETIEQLKVAEQPEKSFHAAMLSHCLALAKMSRSKVSACFEDWDMQDRVFRGERAPDKDDVDQERKGKPVKMVVPNTFAQVMTFTSFLFLMFRQNRSMFELVPSGDEDYGDKRKDCEAVLNRDFNKSQGSTLLFQHLLDVGRFGLGIISCEWTRKVSRFNVPGDEITARMNGQQTTVREGSSYQEFVKFEGNMLRNVSPYRWLPDTRFPLTEFQLGEFCGHEEEYSMSRLRELEAAEEVAGVEHIKPLAKDWMKSRGETRTSFTDTKDTSFLGGPSQSEGTVLVTKMQVRIVPSKFKFDGEEMLGPEEHPVLYVVWYANDNRVIRCEPANWWHDKFSYAAAQFTPDMHRTLNLGLAELVYRLQEVISWFVNSHITSVRRVIGNRLIIDPKIVDTKSLDGEGDIYLRKGVSVPLDQAVGQLRVQDVTGGHMDNVDALGRLMEVVTGVNGNAMGQYNSGRRSAREVATVTSGAAGRMKMHAHLIWESSLNELAVMMLSNSRQTLSAETFRRVIGTAATPERYALFQGTPADVICSDDYFTFDSTMSSEKSFMAQALQELLQVVLSSNPQAAMMFGQQIDAVKLLDEVTYLRGAGNTSRFRYEPGAAPQIMPPVALPSAGAAV